MSAGLTQEALGVAVGLNKKTISAYELGSRAPNFKLLGRIRQVLDDNAEETIDYNKLLEDE